MNLQENIHRIKSMMGLIIEEKEIEKSNSKVIFRKDGDKDIGACIGIAHGGEIYLPQIILDRIKNIDNLHFIAEGNAAKNPEKEPGMMKFINKNFPGYGIEKKSWDEITEDENKGVGNPDFNVVYTFMQHAYNNYIDYYSYSGGTMLDAMAQTTRPSFPPNSPSEPNERKEWLTFYMKKAGFLDKLKQPYDKEMLFKLLTEMEESVYPKGQQVPNTDTYFGKMQQSIEDERNQTIYDLMKNGGVSIAGEGHIDELKQQFPELEFIK